MDYEWFTRLVALIEPYMLPLLLTVLVIAAVRIIFFQTKVWAVSRYCKRHRQLKNDSQRGGDTETIALELAAMQPQVISLFEYSGIVKPHLPVVHRLTRDRVAAASVVSWHHLHILDEPDFSANQLSFSRAIGYYRARRNESINPFFWVISFYNWPKTLFRSFGIDKGNPSLSLLNFLALGLEILGAIALLAPHLQAP